MQKITIMNGEKGDDTVIINGRAIRFPVDQLLPDSAVWAVQWSGESGEIEFKNGDQPNKIIDSMELFQPVIDEFNRLAGIQDAPPPPPTLEEAKAEKLSEINSKADQALDNILATYPSSEVLSWDKQEQEARNWLLDDSTPTPLLDGIAASRGIDKALLVQKVIEKADAFAALSGAIFGKRQMLEDQCLVADTVEQVVAIEVSF